MTSTTTLTEPPPHHATASPPIAVDPSSVLMNLIVAFLAPMFLDLSGGDVHLARLAAIEAIDAYRARSQSDLLAIAQIIACGLAALSSLCQSMTDDVSLSMTLRLRGNAVALNRAAEQNRRILREPSFASQSPHPACFADQFINGSDAALYEANVAAAAAAQQPAAEAWVSSINPEPAANTAATIPVLISPEPRRATPSPAAASAHPPLATCPSFAPLPMMIGEQQAMPAIAMAGVAAEVTTDLNSHHLAERKTASNRLVALSSCANQLLLGNRSPRANQVTGPPP